MIKILLLEDDISLIDGLEYSLQKNGFTVDTVRTVKEALHVSQMNQYDLLILDVTLPDGTGFEVCEKVRRQNNRIPIIFLTASDEEVNIIRGLDSGGDDYITKPFRIGELCSRIRALLRRADRTNPTVSSCNASEASGMAPIKSSDGLAIDYVASRVTLNGNPIELTRAEYRLLCFLVRNTGKVVTRSAILDELWDQAGDFVDDNTLSVYIRRLREKVEDDPSHPKHLLTVRGFGYQWTAQREAKAQPQAAEHNALDTTGKESV